MSKKKNLVFIMTDHQRADSIFMVQDGKEVTPNLNKLAKESVNFTRAYTTSALCVPARTSLATGIYPTNSGVVLNKGSKAADCKPIHQYLKENGYKVAHTGIQHIRLKPDLTDRVEFDLFADEDSYEAYGESQGFSVARSKEDAKVILENQGGKLVEKAYSNARVSEWEYGDDHHKDTYFINQALEFLDSLDGDEPFALFIYLWAPHPPLFVPKSHFEKFNPNRITLPDNVGKPSKNESPTRAHGVARRLAEDIPQDYWKDVWSAHLGLVNYADELIGRVFDKVEEIDQSDNTVTLFTVDHGEHLGQHNMYQKMEMYEQAINIPCIINVPTAEPRQIDEVISHINLVPTVLDLLEIKHENLDGESLMGVFQGEDLSDDRMVFSQYSGNQPSIGDIRRAVITQRYKYIYDGVGTPELYDLENDPLEMDNIAGNDEVKEIQVDLHKACEAFFVANNDWVKY